MKDISVGTMPKLAGCVTTLNAIWVGSSEDIEKQLGYESGRLSLGYSVALVYEPLKPADFEFWGNTMRSDGRYGKPEETPKADKRRRRVHDDLIAEYGADGYRARQEASLKDIVLTGPKRLAKVIPVIRAPDDPNPSKQYPMGGGALQWQLIRELTCLIAAKVTSDGQAITSDFTVNLRRTGDYDSWYQARRRLRRYLETA